MKTVPVSSVAYYLYISMGRVYGFLVSVLDLFFAQNSMNKLAMKWSITT